MSIKSDIDELVCGLEGLSVQWIGDIPGICARLHAVAVKLRHELLKPEPETPGLHPPGHEPIYSRPTCPSPECYGCPACIPTTTEGG